MQINPYCAACLWDKQLNKSDDPAYLAEVRKILDSRGESATAPYMVYLFNQAYERHFGKADSYREIKKKYNDFVLSLEADIRNRISRAPDPLATALAYARVGNFIDFGAMNQIDHRVFFSLLDEAALSEQDMAVYRVFTERCRTAERFLLIADNSGEIVLDKLFLEQLHAAFPPLSLSVMVRGAEVLNDVTAEDAAYVGIDTLARILSTGSSAAGVIYDMLPDDAKDAIDRADVILAKGQGNFESLSDQGRHVFYSLLCKCDLFTERFHVPKFSGVFVERD